MRKVLEQVPDALVAVEVIGRGYRANELFPDGEITGEMWIESVDELVREPVTRVIIRDPQSSAEDFVALAHDLGLHGTNYFVGYTAWLDLAPEGVSKASALADDLRQIWASTPPTCLRSATAATTSRCSRGLDAESRWVRAPTS